MNNISLLLDRVIFMMYDRSFTMAVFEVHLMMNIEIWNNLYRHPILNFLYAVSVL